MDKVVNNSTSASRIHSSVLFVALAVVKAFVLIGEVTIAPSRFVFRVCRYHVVAFFYVIRHIVLYFRRSRQLPLFQITSLQGKVANAWRLCVSSIHLRAPSTYIQQKEEALPPNLQGVEDSSLPYENYMKQGVRSRVKHRIIRGVVVVCIVSIFVLTVRGVFVFYATLPKARDIGKKNYALTTHIYDRNGKRLFDFYTDEHRTPVDIDVLPPYVLRATIAIEDKDFYSHHGVALWSGVVRAIKEIIISKGNGIQGGSTITQQLVKTALLSPERTIGRKIREIIIAIEAERIFTKNQILEMYLNQVPYGGNAYGIEEASQKYFAKSARELTLSEAALLAGLPQSPTSYSPFSNVEGAIYRRNQVLSAMKEQRMINEKEYVTATMEKPVFADSDISIQAPHFVFFVRQYLEKYFDANQIDRAGFRVDTTLDLTIQNFAQRVLTEELAKVSWLNVTNGAILVTKPQTGEILAMVGSLDYFDKMGGEFNVTTGLRQPGSSIKPMVYVRALDKGLTAASLIDDVPTAFRSAGSSEVYRPVNYDGRFHGRVTMRQALANSYNIPAVKILEKITVPDFLVFARTAGIDTWGESSNYGLSLALGGGDVTMTDMAEAYGVLANEGKLTQVYPVHKVIGPNGKTVGTYLPHAKQVVNAGNAYIISDILADNQARLPAFGYGSSLEIPGYKVAVKTGTTDEKRDNWTIGYTPDYLVVVWVGNNDHTPMNPHLTSGITGAAPIWNRVMKYLVSKDAARWYEKPANVVAKQCLGKTEYFISGTESTVPCVLPPRQKTPTP